MARRILLGLFFALACSQSLAASAESEIYTDELTKKGESAFDLFFNVAKSSDISDLKGRTVLQTMGEYSYGLSKRWNIGFKAPLTHADGRWYGNGLLGETKYISADDDDDDGWYWGAEVEAGYLSPYREKRAWVLEVVPILGYKAGRWHFVANPGLSMASAGDEHGLNFEPNFKAAYRLNKKNWLGIEYFVDAGLLKQMLPANRRSETAYLAWDTKIGKSDVNIGIGRGTTAVSDRWVAKFIVEFEFK